MSDLYEYLIAGAVTTVAVVLTFYSMRDGPIEGNAYYFYDFEN